MPNFLVKRLTPQGVVECVQIDALTLIEARHLAGQSGRVLSVVPVAQLSVSFSKPSFNLRIFTHQLLALIEAGQPLVDAIDILAVHDRSGRSRDVLDGLANSLRQGHAFSVAMHQQPSAFPPLLVAMVRSSEQSGALSHALRRFIQYQEQVDGIRSKLVSAIVYPAVLMVVGSLVVAFLLLYVVPRFSVAFDDLHGTHNSVVHLVQWWGRLVRDYTALAWGSVGGAFALGLALVVHPEPRRRLAKRLIRLPWVGERLWVLQLARLYRTLGMLLHSGIGVVAALRLAGSSVTLHTELSQAANEVAEGLPLSVVLPRHQLATQVAQRLLVAGESSGQLDDMMTRIADFYDQETAHWIDLVGRLIEPVLMVLMGLVIGGIVVMLYTPIFELANAI
jgi:general secretion pathway protein F